MKNLNFKIKLKNIIQYNALLKYVKIILIILILENTKKECIPILVILLDRLKRDLSEVKNILYSDDYDPLLRFKFVMNYGNQIYLLAD